MRGESVVCSRPSYSNYSCYELVSLRLRFAFRVHIFSVLSILKLDNTVCDYYSIIMILASEIRDGMAIKLDGIIYKVVTAVFKAGTAKMQSTVHLKLRNIETHTFTEPRLHPEDRIEKVTLDTIPMEYLFHDDNDYYFMHPQTYEQIPFSKERLGNFTKFMTSGMKLKVEFLEDKPIDIVLSKTVDLKVIATGSGVRSDHGSAFKPAELENGMEIAVPQFIKSGDTIRIDVETQHYLDRV